MGGFRRGRDALISRSKNLPLLLRSLIFLSSSLCRDPPKLVTWRVCRGVGRTRRRRRKGWRVSRASRALLFVSLTVLHAGWSKESSGGRDEAPLKDVAIVTRAPLPRRNNALWFETTSGGMLGKVDGTIESFSKRYSSTSYVYVWNFFK